MGNVSKRSMILLIAAEKNDLLNNGNIEINTCFNYYPESQFQIDSSLYKFVASL